MTSIGSSHPLPSATANSTIRRAASVSGANSCGRLGGTAASDSTTSR